VSANIQVSIKVEFKPIDSPPTILGGGATRTGQGQFEIVLDGEKSLDIDALEDGLLRANYPALRDALAVHLEQEVKKGGVGKASIASIAS
jgi:hypothetical protein